LCKETEADPVTLVTEIPTGSLIDQRYRIDKVLGQGGFGRTYLVYDTLQEDHPCVLKELLASQTGHPQKSTELFQREAKVLAKLQHPQIPKFLGWFEEKDRLFIVQEFIEGKTYLDLLSKRIKEGKKFSEAEIMEWLADLLPVLDYIHSQGVIHRDISPDNIMLPAKGGKPILIDFGVVKQMVTELGSHVSGATQVSKHGYSAPEQGMGRCYPSSDLYALASTALYLLTGEIPSQLFDTFAMCWQWERVGISNTFQQILTKMLAHSPKDRYQSAEDVLDSLPNTLATKIISENGLPKTEVSTISPPARIQTQTRKKTTLMIGAIASVCVLSGGIITLGSPHIPQLCKTFNNCAKDKQFQTLYNQEIDQGDNAIETARQAKSISELEQEIKNINGVINQLKTIPEDVKVYQQAQSAINSYQTDLTELNNRLNLEQQAQQKLAQVKTKIVEAKGKTEAAKTLNDYRQAQATFTSLENELNTISKTTFVASEVSTKLTEIQQQEAAINSKINAIVAEENRQRQAAEAERRRKQQAQAAAAQKTRTQTKPRNSSTGSYNPSRSSTPSRTSSSSKNRNSSGSTPRRNSSRSSGSSQGSSSAGKEPLW
jgi:serine/threonine-protein kinase